MNAKYYFSYASKSIFEMFMHIIQIFGPGCAKCNRLEEYARKAILNLGPDFTIEKISDYKLMAEMGIILTPALALDGKVLSSGTLLNPIQIEKLISSELKLTPN
jgi:small redox-active disulfide protein 2